MGQPLIKRRKIDHESASEDNDLASFGSFGDDEEPNPNSDDLSDESIDSESNDEDEPDAGASSEQHASKSKNDALNGKIAKSQPQRKHTSISQSAASSDANALTSGTFKSTTFKLQIEELLRQIKPRHGKRETLAEAALHTLKASIEKIPERKPRLWAEAERELIFHKVAIPFSNPLPPRDAKYKFSYAKPANINVVGSFSTKTSAGTEDVLEVDMLIMMPSELFEEKDYLNYRYYYKRAYYLACVAAGLKVSHGTEYSFRFRQHHENPLKPILVVQTLEKPGVKPTLEKQPSWRINIIPCVTSDQFPVGKLAPSKNCVRSAESPAQEDSNTQSTSFYNSSLRSDMLLLPYLKLLHSTKKACASYVDACLLGNTWLRQRGFKAAVSDGGFGQFEWNALIALALTGGGAHGKPLLSESYSSYQLFKATLQLLASKDLIKNPLLIGQASTFAASRNGVPILWDGAREHNILYKVSKSACKMLQYEARLTLNALNDQLHDGFEPTFIYRVQQPFYHFEHTLRIPSQSLVNSKATPDLENLAQLDRLYAILRKGLGDRVHSIYVCTSGGETWKLGSARPAVFHRSKITAGFVVNPGTIGRTVDHGPSAEDKAEAAEFRKFWGNKAELRRFRDGSIRESLVWSSDESSVSVFEQIVQHLLKHHFGDSATEDLEVSGNEFEKLIRAGTVANAFEPFMTQFKRLENDIRGLEDFPLSIRQIMPSDPQLRYTAVRSPAAGSLTQPSAGPAEVVIQFESSGRWPDDLIAIQRTKLAFLLKLDELLSEHNDAITTRIGLENEDHDVLNQAFLDITYDLHPSFRLRIYHDREQTLFERQLKNKSLDPKTREIAAHGLATHKRDNLRAPAHTQALARLSTRYPALSGAIRLMKKWFASHLLAHHIADEVIELIVANTFINPWPWGVPASIQTGFLRSLHWLARWDWRVTPLIVDLSDARATLKQPDLHAISTRFSAWRKLDPDLSRVALFAASNADLDGTTWTDGAPIKVVAARMTTLAKAACAELESSHSFIPNPADLFLSPLSDFDFILHLNPTLTSSSPLPTKSSQFKNLALDHIHDPTSLPDSASLLLADLEVTYGSAILFFPNFTPNNPNPTPLIAALFSPLTTAPRAWKVNLAYSTRPVRVRDRGAGANDVNGDEREKSEEVHAKLNQDAVLAEIARLAGEIVTRVQVCKEA